MKSAKINFYKKMQQNLEIYIHVPHMYQGQSGSYISVHQRFENDPFHCSFEYVNLLVLLQLQQKQ
jgi:hypothetical protein